MTRLVLRSVVMLVGAAFVGSIVIFGLLRLMPGDFATMMLGQSATPESVAKLRTEMGLDRPLLQQYVDWISGLMRGDLGTSFAASHDIGEQLRARFGLTLGMTIGTMALATIIALVAGTYSALHVAAKRGLAVDLVAQVGVALPTFWVGILLLTVFSIRLGWFPGGGYTPWSQDWRGAISSLTLPVVALSISLGAVLARYVRSSMIEVLSEDYIITARAKGRTLRSAAIRHGLRNASIPLVTVGVLAFGGLLTGVAVIEAVFGLSGLGRMLVTAALSRDVLTVQSLAMVFLVLILVLNFLMEIAYGLLDPRIRDSARG